MIVVTLPVGMLQANCYIVGCPETHEGAIIDPGGDPELILAEVRRHKLTIKYVLNTHAHFDHTAANRAVVEATAAALAIHPKDRALLMAGSGGQWFGLSSAPSPAPTVDLQPGDRLEVGRLVLEVLHTPGHSPGHVSFYERDEGAVFDGDVLFNRGIGRSDLPGGSWQQLLDSIRRVLLALPDDTIVYSGHGPATTIGEEKLYNPWLQDLVL